MAFKLGSEKRGFKNPQDNKIFRKKLNDGILGEANNDGSIYIDKSVPDNMVGYVANHEAQHRTDMEIGKTTYNDDYVIHMGQLWPRANGYIMDPNTGKRYMEGDTELPWEANKI